MQFSKTKHSAGKFICNLKKACLPDNPVTIKNILERASGA